MNILQVFNLYNFPNDLKNDLYKLKQNFNYKIILKNESNNLNDYDNFEIKFNDINVFIEAANKRSLMYAFDEFLKLYKNKNSKIFKTNLLNRSYFLDISRGKIPNKKFFKNLIIYLRKNKINNFQIYVEPNFIKNKIIWIKYFDKKMINYINNICKINNIILIPAIASFSHLYDLVKNNKNIQKLTCTPYQERKYYFNDKMNHYTLDPLKEHTFEISKKIIDTAMNLFDSKIINIGCDEPFDMQSNYYKNINNNYLKTYLIYLKKLTNYVIEKNWTPYIWADIFVFKKIKNYNNLNKKVVLLNWNYNSEIPMEKINVINDKYKQILCGSDCIFGNQFLNIKKATMNQDALFLNLKNVNNVIGVLVTHWGDFGHLNSIVFGLLVLKNFYNNAYNIYEKNTHDENLKLIFYSLIDEQLINYRNFISWLEWQQLKNEYLDYEEKRNNFIKNISSYKPFSSINSLNNKINFLLKNKHKINWLNKFLNKVLIEELEIFRQINNVINMLIIKIQKNFYNIYHQFDFSILKIKHSFYNFKIIIKKYLKTYYVYEEINNFLEKIEEIINLVSNKKCLKE